MLTTDEVITIDQIVYRQGYQYINVSPTTIVAPLVAVSYTHLTLPTTPYV